MIDSIFYVLNMGVLIAAGVFIFKKYFSSSIKKNIEDENRYLQSLKEERQDLNRALGDVERAILTQESLCKTIMLKANKWKDVFDKQIEESKISREQIYLIMQKKLAMQTETHAVKYAYKQIAPDVIELLKRDLEAYFENEDNAHKYLHKTISYLKRETYE